MGVASKIGRCVLAEDKNGGINPYLEHYHGSGRKEEQIHFRLVTVMQKQLELTKDIEDWEHVVDTNPNSRGLQMQLEIAYNKKGNDARTIRGWKTLVDKHPTNWELAIHLKRAYDKKEAKKGKNDTQIEGWKELVRNHPSE